MELRLYQCLWWNSDYLPKTPKSIPTPGFLFTGPGSYYSQVCEDWLIEDWAIFCRCPTKYSFPKPTILGKSIHILSVPYPPSAILYDIMKQNESYCVLSIIIIVKIHNGSKIEYQLCCLSLIFTPASHLPV